jgi:hypothetical protein
MSNLLSHYHGAGNKRKGAHGVNRIDLIASLINQINLKQSFEDQMVVDRQFVRLFQ